MALQTLALKNITFAYPSSSAYLFEDFSIQLTSGWTGIVGPNGLGKTTLLRLIAGQLEPVQGHIQCPGQVIYCPQRTDEPPAALAEFMAAVDYAACMWRGRLQIENDWHTRWHTLSHGQRKRAQIAVALWQQAHVLALDEPTNHIDQAGRQLILEALQAFVGIGLMVSHDRGLLDSLCHKTLCIDTSGSILRPGGYSEAVELARAETQQQKAKRTRIKQQLGKLNQERAKRARAAGQATKRRSKKGLSSKDHDAKSKRDLARVSGKDGQAGRQYRQLAGRQRQLQESLTHTFVKKQPGYQLKLPSQAYAGDALVSLPAGSLALGPHRMLYYPELLIHPRDRIGLTGDNGTGKTRMIQFIHSQLTLPKERIVYVPQEICASQAVVIVKNVRQLPKEQLGTFMTIISSLGSDPQRLLETDLPSPGEIRKLLLALGVVHCPYLIIMDEPTNHLDLPAIEALERALDSCDCVLLLVSHDSVFLQALVKIHWAIKRVKSSPGEQAAQLVIC